MFRALRLAFCARFSAAVILLHPTTSLAEMVSQSGDFSHFPVVRTTSGMQGSIVSVNNFGIVSILGECLKPGERGVEA